MRMAIVIGLGLGLVARPGMAQDAEKGEQVFRKCAACHQVGEDAKNRMGPILTGVVGRPAGSAEGFRYGKSMQAAAEAGLVWDEEAIFDYIADPTGFLRDYLDDSRARAKMTFKLRAEEDRRDVIAYLAGFSPDAETAHDADAPEPQDAIETAADRVCVRNASAERHFFAVEAEGAGRQHGYLDPGARICADGVPPGQTGMVSVFESPDALEGCSRLVPAGQTEDMIRYVDFDRCFWSSNT